jgi:hypothetical protein
MSSSAEVAPVATLPDAHIAPTEELGREPKRKSGIGMTIVLTLVALFWI